MTTRNRFTSTSLSNTIAPVKLWTNVKKFETLLGMDEWPTNQDNFNVKPIRRNDLDEEILSNDWNGRNLLPSLFREYKTLQPDVAARNLFKYDQCGQHSGTPDNELANRCSVHTETGNDHLDASGSCSPFVTANGQITNGQKDVLSLHELEQNSDTEHKKKKKLKSVQVHVHNCTWKH